MPKNIDELIKNIEDHCPKNYTTRITEKGKPINNLANFGGAIGREIIIERKGEYEVKLVVLLSLNRIPQGIGFTLEETTKGLISSQRMINALKSFKEDNFTMVMRHLWIEQEGSK